MNINKKLRYPGRHHFMVSIFALMFVILVSRTAYLQVFQRDFLQQEGENRSVRAISIPAYRGSINDRHGEPLAASAPLEAVWIDPQRFDFFKSNGEVKSAEKELKLKQLASILNLSYEEIVEKIKVYKNRRFMYLKRQVIPKKIEQIKTLDLAGIYFQREYRRFYPDKEIASQIIGFTNIDDNGQEGIELLYNDWLAGQAGAKKVIKDRRGNVVADLGIVKETKSGRDIYLSIDRYIQSQLYMALDETMQEFKAKGASAVILDAKTNEVLAMVSLPSFDPNNRSALAGTVFRNRTVTDVFEPGSTMKPFTVVSGLESGLYKPDTVIKETRRSTMKVSKYTIRDVGKHGVLDVAGVIQKSSNVGAATIALSLPADQYWNTLNSIGFGRSTAIGFPGEQHGVFRDYESWGITEQASLGYGYGVSTTVIQLAHAYTVLANDGINRPISLLKLDKPEKGVRVISAQSAQQVRMMMETVVGPGGTAIKAQVEGYRVGGKTGTVHKVEGKGYSKNKYRSLFAGIVPVENPRLVMVIMVDEAQGKHYGGQVAAPVFSKVMTPVLRYLNVPPSTIQDDNVTLVKANF